MKRQQFSYWIVAAAVIAFLGTTRLVLATELAKIGDTVISLEEFNKKYQENLKFFPFNPPKKKQVLEDVVNREVAIQEARRLGVDKDPEVIERIKTVLFHSLVDKQLTKEFEKINISDSEAKSFYSKNPELRTSHIFVAVKPEAKPEELKTAQERIKEIQDKYLKPGQMTFAEVAQKYSDGVAAPMGGDIDFQSREKLDPIYYETALALKTPGKVSQIVKTQYGYHIIKLTAVRPWEDADKGAVKRLMLLQKRDGLFAKYIQDLRRKAKVTIRSELIKE